jgi:hypothetical protein
MRACFENRSGRDCERGGVDGKARGGRIFDENSVTEEQRSQPPRPAARPPEIFSKHALETNLRRTKIERTACFIGLMMVLAVVWGELWLGADFGCGRKAAVSSGIPGEPPALWNVGSSTSLFGL